MPHLKAIFIRQIQVASNEPILKFAAIFLVKLSNKLNQREEKNLGKIIHMTRHQAKILFTCLNAHYESSLDDSYSIVSIFSSKKGMNSVSMVYNFRSSCFQFVKNCFTIRYPESLLLCSSSPCFPCSFVPKNCG